MRISGTGRRPAGKKSSGFTLLEILVVVALIAIMTVAVVPQFLGNTGRGALTSASNQVTNMMWFCHSSAAYDGQTFRFNYEPERRRFWISYCDDSDSSPNPGDETREFKPYRQSGLAEFILPETVSVKSFTKGIQEVSTSDKDHFIEFSNDGTADAAGIVLCDSRRVACTILVSGITSQIQLVDHEVKTDQTNEVEGE